MIPACRPRRRICCKWLALHQSARRVGRSWSERHASWKSCVRLDCTVHLASNLPSSSETKQSRMALSHSILTISYVRECPSSAMEPSAGLYMMRAIRNMWNGSRTPTQTSLESYWWTTTSLWYFTRHVTHNVLEQCPWNCVIDRIPKSPRTRNSGTHWCTIRGTQSLSLSHSHATEVI